MYQKLFVCLVIFFKTVVFLVQKSCLLYGIGHLFPILKVILFMYEFFPWGTGPVTAITLLKKSENPRKHQ